MLHSEREERTETGGIGRAEERARGRQGERTGLGKDSDRVWERLGQGSAGLEKWIQSVPVHGLKAKIAFSAYPSTD